METHGGFQQVLYHSFKETFDIDNKYDNFSNIKLYNFAYLFSFKDLFKGRVWCKMTLHQKVA